MEEEDQLRLRSYDAKRRASAVGIRASTGKLPWELVEEGRWPPNVSGPLVQVLAAFAGDVFWYFNTTKGAVPRSEKRADTAAALTATLRSEMETRARRLGQYNTKIRLRRTKLLTHSDVVRAREGWLLAHADELRSKSKRLARTIDRITRGGRDDDDQALEEDDPVLASLLRPTPESEPRGPSVSEPQEPLARVCRSVSLSAPGIQHVTEGLQPSPAPTIAIVPEISRTGTDCVPEDGPDPEDEPYPEDDLFNITFAEEDSGQIPEQCSRENSHASSTTRGREDSEVIGDSDDEPLSRVGLRGGSIAPRGQSDPGNEVRQRKRSRPHDQEESEDYEDDDERSLDHNAPSKRRKACDEGFLSPKTQKMLRINTDALVHSVRCSIEALEVEHSKRSELALAAKASHLRAEQGSTQPELAPGRDSTGLEQQCEELERKHAAMASQIAKDAETLWDMETLAGQSLQPGQQTAMDDMIQAWRTMLEDRKRDQMDLGDELLELRDRLREQATGQRQVDAQKEEWRAAEVSLEEASATLEDFRIYKELVVAGPGGMRRLLTAIPDIREVLHAVD